MDRELRSGFVRQRRNLIASSLGLLLLQSAGLRLEKVSVLGNEFRVQHSDFLSIALWVAYVYFLIRYYQHFHDIGDKGVTTIYRVRVNTLLNKWAYNKVRREFLKSQEHSKSTQYCFKDGEYKRSYIDKMAAMIDITVPVDIINKRTDGVSVSGSVITKTETADWPILFRIRVQAGMHVIFRTRLMSEYYLPYFVAASPLIWELFF